jgi:ribA/ribD-fused uncharacterized protein
MSKKVIGTRGNTKKDTSVSPAKVSLESPYKASPMKDLHVKLSGTSAVEMAINTLSEKMDQMQGSLNKVHVELKDIHSDMDTITELKESLEYTQKEMIEVKNHLSELGKSTDLYRNENIELTHRLKLSEGKNKATLDRLIQLESYIRRENLKITGIQEDKNESNYMTEKKVRDLFVKQLKIDHGYDMEFQRCHRLGSPSDKISRDIIVRFLCFQDREYVWSNKYKLKGTNFVLKEDFPAEVEQRRSTLYPIMKAAKNNQQKTRLIADKLIIDGQRFTVETLEKLPSHLQPANLSTKILDNAVLFFGKESYLSSFFPAPFVLDAKAFSGPEQFLQYEKALHASDAEAAGKILETTDPVIQMRIGRRVITTEEQWGDNTAEAIMEAALKAKFAQNPELKKRLLDTGNRLIIECNVKDKFWGNGLHLQDTNAAVRSKWSGRNMLGTILVRVRDGLK